MEGDADQNAWIFNASVRGQEKKVHNPGFDKAHTPFRTILVRQIDFLERGGHGH